MAGSLRPYLSYVGELHLNTVLVLVRLRGHHLVVHSVYLSTVQTRAETGKHL